VALLKQRERQDYVTPYSLPLPAYVHGTPSSRAASAQLAYGSSIPAQVNLPRFAPNIVHGKEQGQNKRFIGKSNGNMEVTWVLEPRFDSSFDNAVEPWLLASFRTTTWLSRVEPNCLLLRSSNLLAESTAGCSRG